VFVLVFVAAFCASLLLCVYLGFFVWVVVVVFVFVVGCFFGVVFRCLDVGFFSCVVWVSGLWL